MKEVSSKAFGLFFEPFEAKGVPPERIVAGTQVTLDLLKNKNERIDWSDFCVIMNNLRPFFTDAEYTEIGRQHLRVPMLRAVFVVGRLLFTPIGFYRWFNKPREGGGNQLFSCIVPSQRDLSSREIEVDLTVADGYEVCWDFYTIARGNFIEMPRLLGYPPATVTFRRLARGARFHITLPTRAGVLTRLRRAITWPFTVRAAARELQDAHLTLQDRYEQLEDARTRLARRQEILDAAYQLGQGLWSELDPAAVAANVARGLSEVHGVRGARLRVTAAERHTADEAGIVGDDGEAIGMDLAGHRATGRLDLWAADGSEPEYTRMLLELVAPTVALAINNAHAYRELSEYQQTLERRVDERTHALSDARDALAATVLRLEEVQQDRERLFQNISHEFRTPLALILLSVDAVLASRGATGDDQRIAHLGTVTASARKLVRMVDELLLLAAGRERELGVHPQPIDMQEAVDAAAAGWSLAARAAGQTLTVTAPAGVVGLVDPLALERVLANLLSNAVKFSPPGGQIRIDVMPPATAGAMIEVTVADNGIGIDDDLAARLFGRYEQGKGGIASRGGSGIGLSLVRELVRAHGGEVGARANPGGGTVFCFTLPTSAAQPTEPVPAPRLTPSDFGVPVTPSPVLERLEPAGTSRGSVLLAEDDLALAASIARILAEVHHVFIAHDGGTALALAEQHQPDLLITDVQMPGMDGFELTRLFREIKGVPPAPVLLLTARAGLEDRLTGFGVGAVDYLTKPFDPVELRARVRAQLGHRDLTRRLYESEKLASLGALSAGLAHELRNPANGIVNAVAPLKEMLPPELADAEHPVTQLIDVMAECADQIGYLSRQLLGFRRSGDLELRRVPIGDLIDRALANASGALTGVDLRTRLTYTGTVRCALPVLSQVLINLLENAAHAAGHGGWIEISTSRRPGRVTLEVMDSGSGVPVQLRDRIFEPFFTTKPPGQGTGLGLATSRDLVHRHGGTLELRTRGERTVFAVDLPEPPEVS
jgi:signal transduction histidine kinase